MKFLLTIPGGNPDPSKLPYCRDIILFSKETLGTFQRCKQYRESALTYIPNRVNTSRLNKLVTTKDDYLKLARGYCNDVVGSCDNKSAFEIKTLCDAADANQVGKLDGTGLRWAVPVATSLGAGALGAGITASVIKQKKENIKNEAAQKWMDEIGEHIQCYLGTDELGTYGDVVSIELD